MSKSGALSAIRHHAKVRFTHCRLRSRLRLYSDLFLHDMGATLADDIEQGQATGSEFRTIATLRVSERPHFLHNGRATTLQEADTGARGQGAAAARNFEALSQPKEKELLAFLNCI